MYAYHVCAWCPQRPEEGIIFPEIGVRDSSESPCESWEPNPSLLQEQQVLLTPELFLQP